MARPKKQLPFQELDYDDYFTTAELVAIYRKLKELEQLHGWDDQCFLVRFILGTGMRVGEVAGLRISDCGPDRVTVRTSDIHTEKTKTGKIRIVRIMPELLPHYQFKVSKGWQRDDEYLSKGMCKRTLQRWWDDVIREAGVRSRSIHKGRDTYATHELASKRLDLLAVKCQLGHTMDSDVTLKYYTHIPPDYIYSDGEPEWRGEA